jgi:hypothetical protein
MARDSAGRRHKLAERCFCKPISEYGAFLARKSKWQDDLFSFLSRHDKDPKENSASDQKV